MCNKVGLRNAQMEDYFIYLFNLPFISLYTARFVCINYISSNVKSTYSVQSFLHTGQDKQE